MWYFEIDHLSFVAALSSSRSLVVCLLVGWSFNSVGRDSSDRSDSSDSSDNSVKNILWREKFCDEQSFFDSKENLD